MKRTDRVIKFAVALLFVTMVLYMGLTVLRTMNDPIRSTTAVMTVSRQTVPVNGLVVREERVLKNRRDHYSLAVQDGEAVAAASVLGMAYDSDTALAQADRIRELEFQIALAETALAEPDSAQDLLSQEASVRAAVLDFSSSIARHELTELDKTCLRLHALVIANAVDDVSQAELNAMKRELSSLRGSSTEDTVTLTAPASGVFSSILDGYEHLSPENLEDLTADKLRTLMDSEKDSAESAYGKLITGHNWYFAALMDRSDADKLSEDSRVSLEFSRYYGLPLSMRVLSVSVPDKDGICAVVFVCSRALNNTLAMRSASAELIIHELSGLRVPYDAVHTEDGQAYVYIITGLLAERRDISILGDSGEYFIVKTGENLLEGNELLIGGENLYDGKYLQ
ncbi:MAG: HlyD family efflux transporter periplasmic adaptor subunit [Eubacteriales bacterium]|nr:HlyD family efflux transporter periplasmic adaptor subunit [Eubacteriales bacterium]